jgi:hypothetical protein
MARYFKWPFFIIVVISYILIPLVQNAIYIPSYTLTSFVYFYIGIYGGVNRLSFNVTSTAFILGITSLTLISFTLVVLNPILNVRYVNNFYLLCGTITLFLLTYKLIEAYNIRPIPLLAAASAFIYFSHKLGPTYISKQIVGALLPGGEVTEITIFIVSPIIASLICVVMYFLLSKMHHSILMILTGKSRK